MIVAKVLITIAVKSLTQGILDASAISGMETANGLIDNAIKNLPTIMSSPMLSNVPDLATNLKMMEMGLTNLDKSIAKLDAGEITKYDLRNTEDWVTIFAPIKPMIKSFLESKDPSRMMGVQPCRDRFGKSLWLCKKHATLVANQFDPAGGSALGDSIEFSHSQIGASIQSGLNSNAPNQGGVIPTQHELKIEVNENTVAAKNIVLDKLPPLGPNANNFPGSKLETEEAKSQKTENKKPTPSIIAKSPVSHQENGFAAKAAIQKSSSLRPDVSIKVLDSNHVQAKPIKDMIAEASLSSASPPSQKAIKAISAPAKKSMTKRRFCGVKKSYSICGRAVSAKLLIAIIALLILSIIGGSVAAVLLTGGCSSTVTGKCVFHCRQMLL
jgi:hypothetical protein